MGKRKTKSVHELVQKAMHEEIDHLTVAQLKELIMIMQYKHAFTRAQLEVITEVLVENKLATHEEIWKKTNMHFKNSK